MTYKIWYKEYKIFEVELYITESVSDNRLYYTEIKPYIIAEGISNYVFNEIKTKEQLDEFIFDTDQIDDLRELLFEGKWIIPNWTNDPLNYSAADARLCKIHRQRFVKIMKEYCDKYGFFLSED